MRLLALHVRTEHLALAACLFLSMAIVASLIMAPRNALKGRGSARLPISSLGKQSVLQIELARSEEDLINVLQPGNLEANLHDANVGNNLDTFLFIPSYTGLLISLGLLLGRSPGLSDHRLISIGLALTPAIAVCDWGENWGIAKAIRHFEAHGKPETGDALRIAIPSLAKWILAAVVLAVFGIAAFSTGNWLWFPLAGIFTILGLTIAFVLGLYARERWGCLLKLHIKSP